MFESPSKIPNPDVSEKVPVSSIGPNFVENIKAPLSIDALAGRLADLTKQGANPERIKEAQEMLKESKAIEAKIDTHPGWQQDALVVERLNSVYRKQINKYLFEVNKNLSELENGNPSEVSMPPAESVASVTSNNENDSKDGIPSISVVEDSNEEVQAESVVEKRTGWWSKEFRDSRNNPVTVPEVEMVIEENKVSEDLTTENSDSADKAEVFGDGRQDAEEKKVDTTVLSQETTSSLENIQLENPSTDSGIEDAVVTRRIERSEIDQMKINYKEAASKYIHDLNLHKQAEGKTDKQFLANVTHWLNNSKKRYTDAVATLVDARINVQAEFGEIEKEIDQIHKKYSSSKREKISMSKSEQFKNKLTNEMNKDSEKYLLSSRERANRMAKVLSVSLASLLFSAQPAGNQAEAFTANSDFETRSVAETESNELLSAAAVSEVESTETTTETQEQEVSAHTAPVLPNQTFGNTNDTEIPFTTPEAPASVEIPQAETVESPQIVESAEAGSLMIEVPRDSSVSQAVEQSYEAGLFTPYLTREFSSVGEFMNAYWAFDQLVNNHPEIVKNILGIKSGDTDVVPAGSTFDGMPIINAINNESTADALIAQYSSQLEEAVPIVTPQESAVLDTNIQELNSKVVEEALKVTEEAPPQAEIFVTRDAVRAYESGYQGDFASDFNTYLRSKLTLNRDGGIFDRFFNAEAGSADDMYSYADEIGMTVSQFNELRDGEPRVLNSYLREHRVPRRSFDALQTVLYSIGMSRQVQVTDDMTLSEVLRAAFVAEHATGITNSAQK